MQGFAPTRRVLHLTLVKILKIPGKPSPVFIAFFITTKSSEILGSSLLSADWNKADVSWWQKNVIWILLVNCLVGLSLTKKVWLSDQPYMTVVVYHGHLTTTWQQPIYLKDLWWTKQYNSLVSIHQANLEMLQDLTALTRLTGAWIMVYLLLVTSAMGGDPQCCLWQDSVAHPM